MGAENPTWGPYDTYILIGVFILLFLTLFIVPRWLMMNAMKKVLKIMHKHNAISPQTAKFAEELGIKPQSMWDRMFRMRDYKPQALQLLTQYQIVMLTPEGKYYVNQENLAKSKLKDTKFY